jgi:hypothetical protein
MTPNSVIMLYGWQNVVDSINRVHLQLTLYTHVREVADAVNCSKSESFSITSENIVQSMRLARPVTMFFF